MHAQLEVFHYSFATYHDITFNLHSSYILKMLISSENNVYKCKAKTHLQSRNLKAASTRQEGESSFE